MAARFQEPGPFPVKMKRRDVGQRLPEQFGREIRRLLPVTFKRFWRQVFAGVLIEELIQQCSEGLWHRSTYAGTGLRQLMLLVFIDAPRSFGRDRFLAGGEPESADDAPAITRRALQVELEIPIDLVSFSSLMYR